MRAGLVAPPVHGGVTLVETMIAVSIAGFLFLFLGSLTLLIARSAAVTHAQVLAQTSAATASERIAAELRNAVGYRRFAEDDSTSMTFSRIQYLLPATGTTLMTRAVIYDDENDEVQIVDVSETGALLSPPRHRYRHLSGLTIWWESEYRLGIVLEYQYRGFAGYLDGDGNPLLGHCTTDIIAKNHFMDQGVQNYAQSDNPTSGPATL